MPFFTLFVVELGTRRVNIMGTTRSPHGIFKAEVANEMMADQRFLIREDDAKFRHGFNSILEVEGVETWRIPYGAPHERAPAERFAKTMNDECLNRRIFFGADSLVRAQQSFVEHYHRERNHQGIGNRLLNGDDAANEGGAIKVRERLGECSTTTIARRRAPGIRLRRRNESVYSELIPASQLSIARESATKAAAAKSQQVRGR